MKVNNGSIVCFYSTIVYLVRAISVAAGTAGSGRATARVVVSKSLLFPRKGGKWCSEASHMPGQLKRIHTFCRQFFGFAPRDSTGLFPASWAVPRAAYCLQSTLYSCYQDKVMQVVYVQIAYVLFLPLLGVLLLRLIIITPPRVLLLFAKFSNDCSPCWYHRQS